MQQYGALSHDPRRFPLYAVKSRSWDARKPSVLITGGVHGYETSGVQGALSFLNSPECQKFADVLNIAVVPCVSPWGYERVQRWNAEAVDPNRSFDKKLASGAPAREAACLMRMVRELDERQAAKHPRAHATA